MKKRGIGIVLSMFILFLVVLSLIVFVSADEPFITHKSRPKIDLSFGEPINIIDITMRNTDYLDVIYYKTDFDFVYNSDRTNVSLIPKTALDNGLYSFVILVEDLVKNKVTYSKLIMVDVPITDIVMLQPRLLRMNATVGDIIVQTFDPDTKLPKTAHCKHAPLLGYSINKKFEVANEFDQSNSSTHILNDYDFSVPFNKNLYVLCKDSDNRISYKFFKLDYDLVPPIIDAVEFLPPKMITLDNTFNITVITNEDTFCYFEIIGKTFYFNDDKPSDEGLIDSYVTKHVAEMNQVLPAGNGLYELKITCQDRALWKSNITKIYEVDLTQGLEILIDAPTKYVSKKETELKFFTNKPSYCQYSFDGSILLETNSNSSTPVLNHVSKKIHSLSAGKHIFHIECTSDSAQITQFKKLDYDFIMDDSPPLKPVLDGKNISCDMNNLELSAYSTDNESEISHYMYMVEKSGKLVINWTRSDSQIKINNAKLNTTHNSIYFVSVEAYNKAGLKSIPNSKQITFDSTGMSCDNVPPVVKIDANLSFGTTFVSMSCTDDRGLCKGIFYNKDENNICTPDQIYYSPFMIDKNVVLCYLAYDMANNNVSGKKNISVFKNPDNSAHCYNGIYESDLNETDVDCGSDCFPCGSGRRCLENLDCISGFCVNNVCESPSCEDLVKNGDETDVDCGGSCSLKNFFCGIGSKCLSNKDCESGFCGENYTCILASCSDKVQNGNETDIDCGGICKGCAKKSKCISDSDCASNFCKNGYCDDYTLKDSDNDGLPDYWEEKYFGCTTCANPRDDPDEDQLTNFQEFKYGTDPTKKDTDGDRYSDSNEITFGTDPLNSNDHPTNWLVFIFIFLVFLLSSYFMGAYSFDYFKPKRDEYHSKYLKTKEELLKKLKTAEHSDNHFSGSSNSNLMNSVKHDILSSKVENKSKTIIKKKKIITKTIDTTREKERGKIFDAFEKENPIKTTDEFRRILASKLKNKSSLRHKKLSSRLKHNNATNNISSNKIDASLDLKSKVIDAANKNIDISSPDDKEISVKDSVSEAMHNISIKRRRPDISGDPFEYLSKEGDVFSEIEDNISGSVSKDNLKKIEDRFDQLLNIGKSGKSNSGDLSEKIRKKEDYFDTLISKTKDSQRSLDSFDRLSNVGKDTSINNKENKNSDSNINKDLLKNFANSLTSGMNVDVFGLLLKKLYVDKKITSDDANNLLEDLTSLGKISEENKKKIKSLLNI